MFNKKVDVLRITEVSDSIGGFNKNKEVVVEDMPCRIVWKSGDEAVIGGQVRDVRDGVLYCRVNDIREKDLIKDGDVEYEIVSVFNVGCADDYLKIGFKK